MKKHLRPLEIINGIIKLLATHSDGYIRTAYTSPNGFVFTRENPQDTKGFFRITITTACEGSVIGTYSIQYFELSYVPTGEVDSYVPWDVHSEFICHNDVPEYVVHEILQYTEPGSFDPQDIDSTFVYEQYDQAGNVIGYTERS